MILPRGITGFTEASDTPLPLVDLHAFRRHCYETAQQVGGRVGSISDSVSRCSFSAAILHTRNGEVAVILHSHFPLIAFAVPPIVYGPIKFLDSAELSALFSSFGVYQVATAIELEQSLNQEMLQELSNAELDQIAYWKPRRVGDMAFNYWD